MQVRMRQAYVRAVDAGDLPRPCDDILAELRDPNSVRDFSKNVEAKQEAGIKTWP